MRIGLLALFFASELVFSGGAAAQPFRPALLGDDGYNENWILSAEGDSFYAQITFGIANLGPGSGRATCRVLVLTGSKPWREQLVAGAGDWQHAVTPEPRLALPGCTVRGGAATTFTVEVDEGKATFTLPPPDAAEERLRIKNAKGEPRHRESLLLHDAPGQAVINHRGVEKKYAIKASMLHTLSNEAPDEIAPQWIRVRTHDAGEPFTALILIAKKSTETFVFERGKPAQHLTAGGRPLAVIGKSPVVLGEAATAPTLQPKAERAQYEPLREMGMLGRVLGAIVGDPLVSVHDGVWSADGAERRVVLETITFR